MNKITQIAILSALVTLAACSSDSRRDDDRSRSSSSASSPSGGVTGDVYGRSTDEASDTGTSSQAANTLPSGRVVYFEFDSSELKPEGQALVDAWGVYLAANPGIKVRLEGHADERGTREYNVALGERRANTVQQALAARGVGTRQLSVSSFGEERPVSLGHDEAAWAQNRRVEIVQ